MSELIPIGSIPTPYGVSAPLYHRVGSDPCDPEAPNITTEAVALCAGIYEKAERERFVADVKRLGFVPHFRQYGGQPWPTVGLPRPRKPTSPKLKLDDIPIEAWITATMDQSPWCNRAETLINIITVNLIEAATWPDNVVPQIDDVVPVALSRMLTGALEHLCEGEIFCLEAAALYALTEHEEWRRAGLAWLHPFRETWFRDWRNARPLYGAFARTLLRSFDLPEWLCGYGDAR